MRLHINVDHVATLRNARGTPYPDPVDAARVCLDAGAHGITAHLREDRRHIRDADVERLRATLRSTFNLEIAATDEMIERAVATRPDVVTLVPERREERTTEGGLEVAEADPSLARHIEALRAADIKVSLFIAPSLDQVEASHALGVEQIELHTGEYAHAFGYGRASSADLTRLMPDDAHREHVRLAAAAKRGRALGLEIAAGHGLTTRNVSPLVLIEEIIELNIGHAVVADALFMSLGGAVKAMLAAIEERPTLVIVGLGIDVCSIERMRRALERHGDRFFSRICTSAEREDLTGRDVGTALAGRFAAKEAFAKALDGARGVGWHEVQVRRFPSGRPTLELSGNAVAAVERFGAHAWHVSITHDAGVAVAVVVLESRPDALPGSARSGVSS